MEAGETLEPNLIILFTSANNCNDGEYKKVLIPLHYRGCHYHCDAVFPCVVNYVRL